MVITALIVWDCITSARASHRLTVHAAPALRVKEERWIGKESTYSIIFAGTEFETLLRER